MKLLNLNLSNYQGLRALSLDFGGKSASIYGDNATGKTTVYNAITWLLFDRPSTDVKNYTPKTKGADGDLHHLLHSAEASFAADDGRIVTLKKVYHEIYKKKRGSAREEFDGHTVDYYLDGVPAREKEYTAAVLALCGGDAEHIKMLTMPDYFAEGMPWDARRRILLEVCGDVSDADIIAAHDELAELPTFLQMPGSTQSYTIDAYKKVASAKRSDINKELAEIPARIDEAARGIPDTDGLSAAQIEANIEALRRQIDEAMQEKSALQFGNTAAVAIVGEIAKKKTELSEAQARHISAENEKNAAVDTKLDALLKAISSLRKKIDDKSSEIRKNLADRELIERKRKALLDEYMKSAETVWNESDGICPTCHRPLPEEQVARMREEFNQRKSEKLEEINRRGKEEASKDMIAKLDTAYAALDLERSSLKTDMAAKQEEMYRLQGNRVYVNFEDTEEYRKISKALADLQAQQADAYRVASEATVSVDAKITGLQQRLKDELAKRMAIKVGEAQKQRIAELEEREKKLAADYERIEQGIYLCDVFTKLKVAALTDKINDKFSAVRFRLFQDQINGGVKDDCEVMIPREDGALVPYTFANNAARINAGLEIINTLSAHWGIQMPVCIDNAESVTRLRHTDAQVIRLVVSEEDKQMRLEVDDDQN